MKNLLVISPRWGNASSPDTQRVRSMLPYLGACGWRATIVAASENATRDGAAEIVTVRPWSARATRWMGIKSDAIRALVPLRARFSSRTDLERYDLAFFSTTAFPLWRMGPRWARRGLPYVLDWQDPWVDEDPAPSVRSKPPGGRIKYGVSQWSARLSERAVVRSASAHVAVSGAYLESIARRHGLDPDVPCVVEPFATDTTALMAARSAPRPAFLAESARSWVCVGRLGEGFAPALEAFFAAFADAIRQVAATRVHITLVGTAYGPEAPAIATPLAEKYGVADRVTELPARVSPDEALAAQAHAELILMFGSDDSRYVPSRLLNAVGIGRPLLVVSPTSLPNAWNDVIRGVEGVSACEPEVLADELVQRLASPPARGHFPRNELLASRSAEQMTARLARVFDSAVSSGVRQYPT
jgi:hypothetical protein